MTTAGRNNIVVVGRGGGRGLVRGGQGFGGTIVSGGTILQGRGTNVGRGSGRDGRGGRHHGQTNAGRGPGRDGRGGRQGGRAAAVSRRGGGRETTPTCRGAGRDGRGALHAATVKRGGGRDARGGGRDARGGGRDARDGGREARGGGRAAGGGGNATNSSRHGGQCCTGSIDTRVPRSGEETPQSTPNNNTNPPQIEAKATKEKKEKKEKVKAWQHSKAKAFLRKLLLDKSHNYLAKPAREIYQLHHKIFSPYKYENFRNNLRSLKKAVINEGKFIEIDEEIFRREQEKFPRAELTNRGQPFWPDHPAALLLEEDVKNGKADELKPLQMWLSNDEYQDFDLYVFRKHIYQEKRKQKETVAWQFRRNKSGKKEVEKEAQRLKDEFEKELAKTNFV